MSPTIFSCVICGYLIDGYAKAPWLKEFRASMSYFSPSMRQRSSADFFQFTPRPEESSFLALVATMVLVVASGLRHLILVGVGMIPTITSQLMMNFL